MDHNERMKQQVEKERSPPESDFISSRAALFPFPGCTFDYIRRKKWNWNYIIRKKKYFQVKQSIIKNSTYTCTGWRGPGLCGVAAGHSTWFERALLGGSGSTGNAGVEVEVGGWGNNGWMRQQKVRRIYFNTNTSTAVQGNQMSNDGEGRSTINTLQSTFQAVQNDISKFTEQSTPTKMGDPIIMGGCKHLWRWAGCQVPKLQLHDGSV